MSRPLIIGHRGAAAQAPENTLASFARALDNGADGIEFDVRLAGDDVPVVIHDASLRRTALREGNVRQVSSTELSRIDVGTWFNQTHRRKACAAYVGATIPTLAEVFAMLKKRDAQLYLEMKCEASADIALLAQAVASLIYEYDFYHRVIVESFALTAIAEIKRLAPEIRTAALFERRWSRPVPSIHKMLTEVARCSADEIALHHTLVNGGAIRAAHAQNIRTVVWTVDRPAWIERAIVYDIHALITNDPARMRARLREIDSA
jgi:glycerophosphoryl diester phosphodiesterase